MPGAPIPTGDCASVECARFKWEVLCDNGTAPATSFLRCYFIDCESGEVTLTIDTELDGLTPYTVMGDVGVCAGDINIPATNVVDAELICFDAAPTPLMRVTVYDPLTGALVAGPFWRDPLTGLPAVPAGSVIPCPDAEIDVELKCLCDDGTDPFTTFLRVYVYTDGVNTAVSDVELDGTTPYVLVGDAVPCLTVIDDSTPIDVAVTGQPISIDDNGGSLTVDGTVDVGNWRDDAEFEILCDDDTDPPTPFLRRYDVDDTGTVTVADTELDGTTAYVVVGTVVECPASIDGTVEVVADPTADVSTGMVLLSGVGSWTLGVDSGGGKVKSITVIRRTGGGSTSVTIDDDFGNSTAIISGESLTWSVSGLEDELSGTFVVTTTSGGDRVLVLWTEV